MHCEASVSELYEVFGLHGQLNILFICAYLDTKMYNRNINEYI